MTSSHQMLAVAFSGVVIISFDGPGQKGERQRWALRIFLALIQKSLSVIGLMPRSDGLPIDLTGLTGVTEGGSGFTDAKIRAAGGVIG
jgi:hypothetical protein